MKLDFNFDGKTLLKKWWQQVKSNFQTVQDEYNRTERRQTVRLRAKFQPKYRTERERTIRLKSKFQTR